jgi:hypothetical protein
MPGPLPAAQRQRRNAPTIPTTELPAGGRSGPAPTVPPWTKLARAGRAWWRWAWSTPQACAWGVAAGQEAMVARRAALEDDLAALETLQGLDLGAALEASDRATELDAVIRRVAAMATGRLAIVREMRELDDRLGLTPRGLAQLRWRIVDTAGADPVDGDEGTVSQLDERRARLTDAS